MPLCTLGTAFDNDVTMGGVVMRVLVTGGAGYVGSRVSAHLLETGMDVTVFDRLIYGGEGLLSLLDHPRFRFVAGDIRDEDAMRAAISDVDAVVHMAALVGEAACQVDPNATMSINYEGTQLVARVAEEVGVECFVFLSTCSNYGVSDPHVLADEDTPLRPLSLYAESKVLAEKAVLAANDQLATCVLRLGTVCGLSPRMRFNLLINDMARSAALGKKISIYSPDAWRPFLHIRDAARVILHCLTVSSASVCGQVFNVVGENFPKRQLAELVLTHFPGVMVEQTDTTADPRDYRVTADRIALQLGFRPAHTIEEAFLEVATAVRCGVFNDPHRPIYEALPDIMHLHVREP
jgi:nucleoside-diphosphate-sugar epimerase